MNPSYTNTDDNPPSIEELEEMENEGGCTTPCGCWVEPDGTCEHEQESWLLILGYI